MGELDFLAEATASRPPANLVVAIAAGRRRRRQQLSMALTLGSLLVGLTAAAVLGLVAFSRPSDGAAEKAGPAFAPPPAIAEQRPPIKPAVPAVPAVRTVSKQRPAVRPKPAAPLSPPKPAAPRTDEQDTADAIGLLH
jgi:hypothetical protein